MQIKRFKSIFLSLVLLLFACICNASSLFDFEKRHDLKGFCFRPTLYGTLYANDNGFPTRGLLPNDRSGDKAGLKVKMFDKWGLSVWGGWQGQQRRYGKGFGEIKYAIPIDKIADKVEVGVGYDAFDKYYASVAVSL